MGYAFRKHYFFKMYISSRLKGEDVYIKSPESEATSISLKEKARNRDST